MKTAIIILLLVAATAQNLSAKDRRAELYLYGRVSTALRVESSDLKDWFGDWSFGGDAGLGIWYGTFHAGVSGVITCPTRGMGENPSPSGEDFSKLAVPWRITARRRIAYMTSSTTLCG